MSLETKRSSLIEGNIVKGPEKLIKFDYYNIGEALFETFTSEPNHVAQIDSETGRLTTFEEMKDKSVRCALWLKKQGITEDDIVVLCTHNHLDTYVPVVATTLIEAIYSSWDHEITEYSAKKFMKAYKPTFIFACEKAAPILKEASKAENLNVKIIVFGQHPGIISLNEIMQEQTELEVEQFLPRKEKDLEKVAAILLTSGSTGIPKGVMYSGNTLALNFYTETRYNKRIFLSYSTLLWATGLVFMQYCIFSRSTKVISPGFDAEDFCRIVEKYKVTSCFLTSTMLARLEKYDGIEKYNLQSLRVITSAGAKIASKTIENLQKRISNIPILLSFGMTELARNGTIARLNPTNNESIGDAGVNIQMKMVDPVSGETLGPNQPGELCIKSPNMMMGYYNNPEETKKAIDEEGWLHTGDLCQYSEDGEIFLKDRLKELMQYQNIRITPTEIEEVLMSHPAVMEVAVAPVPHELDGERPMAFVKITPGQKVTEEELIELSMILGEKKKLHGGVKFLNELPRTGNGKIARSKLKQLARSIGDADITW